MKSWVKLLFLVLLLLDLAYSTVQYYSEPLDGDVARVVLPTEYFKQVLEDPFGMSVLLKGEEYGAPNRYFVHRSMSTYFKTVPFFFQKFISAIESIYYSSALFKILLHLLLLYLLAAYSSAQELGKSKLLIAAVLLTPLFQNSIFNSFIGLMSTSISYAFSYTFPMTLLLLFFLPFYQSHRIGVPASKSIKPLTSLGLFALMIALAFSGPLVAPVVVIICPAVLLYIFFRNFKKAENEESLRKIKSSFQQIPGSVLFFFLLFPLLCLYSFYIGTFNMENINTVSIAQRYQLMSKGLFNLLTLKLAYPIFLLFLIINTVFIFKSKEEKESKDLLDLLKLIGLFSLIYIAFLPLGGYREYRQFIVRSDTLLPVNLALFYFYGKSSLYLIRHLKGKTNSIYVAGLFLLSLIFTISDQSNFGKNDCEKEGLAQIANSKEKTVVLDNNCSIMEWDVIRETWKSEGNGKLLKIWNITDDEKTYYTPE